MLATALAMVAANSPLQNLYEQFVQSKFGFHYHNYTFQKPLLSWVNEGLMAVFFYSVTGEIRTAFRSGALSSKETAIMPIVAALSGVIVPACIFVGINYHSQHFLDGWAIPTATDIAFSLAVLFLFAKNISPRLRVFLLAIAVIDDLIAILLIAVFYTEAISLPLIIIASAFVVLLGLFRYFKLNSAWAYGLVGFAMWVTVLKSGVHATLAGVIVAMFIPHDQLDTRQRHIELGCHYFIMPVFAFMNAGVVFGSNISGLFNNTLFSGIFWGLLAGKPIGISLSMMLLQRCLLKQRFLNVYDTLVLGFLCAIGFTMSLFIGTLAFSDDPLRYTNITRLAVITASLSLIHI